MNEVVRSIALGATMLLLTMSAARGEEARQSAPRSEIALASTALPQAEIYSDPYRRYFSGHWCDCWRKANQSPIDEKAMFEGILPRTDTPVWQQSMIFEMKDMTADEKFLCRAASGLIHRIKGIWYCTEDNDFWFKGSRQFFKDGITGPPIKGIKQGNIGGQVIGFTLRRTGNENYLVAVKRFIVELDPPSIDSCVIYDGALLDPAAKPKQPRDMLNVVRMICAVERAVPLTPRLHQDLMKLMGGKPLPIVKDTTQWDEFNIDKFHGDEKAAAYALYAWAFNNFWKNDKNPKRQCTHHVLAYMPPMGLTDSAEQDLTDYIVQQSIFTFYSYGGDNMDEKHMEYVLTQSPMNIPVIGQLTNKTGAEAAAESARVLRLFSRFGKYFVDSSVAGNLSMHSGQREKERVALKQKPASPVTLDPAKSYVAFCLTGSNSLSRFMTLRPSHWDVASRGSIPLGWAIPLAAADVAPNIAKFYYKDAKPNDCFVADVGGLGLALPTVWGKGSNQPDSLLASYFQRSKEYLGYLDLSTLWMAWLDQQALDNLAKNVTGLQGVFYGVSGANRNLDRASYMAGSLPVIFTYTDLVANAVDLDKLPGALAQAKERFFFIGVDESGFGPSEDVVAAIAKTAQKLGDKFVVVRPDQLPTLFAEAVKAKQVPAEPPKLTPDSKVAQDMSLKHVADGAIKVDGNPAEWSKLAATKIFVTRDGRTVADSAKLADTEIAAEVTAAIDSRFLYVLARVRDNDVIVDDVNLTAGDHVVLSLDTRRSPFREPEMTEGFYRLALVPAAGLIKNPRLVLQYPTYDIGLVSMNKHGVQEELSSVVSRDGYLIEAAIPLANFPGCTWKESETVAIGFGVHNLDSRAATASVGSQTTTAVRQ
jgi:hypothetical protein